MNLLTGKSLAVLNSSRDTVELLKSWFELEGMIVHTAAVSEFRTGGGDLYAFIARSAPDVIVYDVALPYMPNWQFLEEVRNGPLKGIPLIVTTPNEHILRTVISATNDGQIIHEIVGKPADMQQLTSKVIGLVTARYSRSPDEVDSRRPLSRGR